MSAPTQGSAALKLSVNITNFSYPGAPESIAAELTSLTQACDDIGVDTVWVSDHLWQADPSGHPEEPMLEAYSLLGFLAATTSRVRLGTMVTAATFRAPALLIKAVTTLEVLSGGRAFGLYLPPTAERFDRLTEVLQLAHQMWDGVREPFRGRYYQPQQPICIPAPLSGHRIPVLIGGTGEKRTLRLVAEYAQAANFFDVPDGGATLSVKRVATRHHMIWFVRCSADFSQPFRGHGGRTQVGTDTCCGCSPALQCRGLLLRPGGR
jgi:alkanesulfonate monooxygenase SsuD/methylene tetrahydromethanopterin reductase-like flavin-dependent oxidoreductase (luciferase family)